MRCDKYKIVIIFFVCICDLILEFYCYIYLFIDEVFLNCIRDVLDLYKY